MKKLVFKLTLENVPDNWDHKETAAWICYHLFKPMASHKIELAVKLDLPNSILSSSMEYFVNPNRIKLAAKDVPFWDQETIGEVARVVCKEYLFAAVASLPAAPLLVQACRENKHWPNFCRVANAVLIDGKWLSESKLGEFVYNLALRDWWDKFSNKEACV